MDTTIDVAALHLQLGPTAACARDLAARHGHACMHALGPRKYFKKVFCCNMQLRAGCMESSEKQMMSIIKRDEDEDEEEEIMQRPFITRRV